MKLKEACSFGVACGLETIGESVRNIDIHAISIFSYADLNKELNELYSEFNLSEAGMLIKDKYPELYSEENNG